jgi:hypothetical protein
MTHLGRRLPMCSPPPFARQRPGAAASLREGLEDTLTVNRLGITDALLKTPDSTNPVESIDRDRPGPLPPREALVIR